MTNNKGDSCLSYDKELFPLTGKSATLTFPIREEGKVTERKMEGTLSRGPIYYSIQGRSGCIILMPGSPGKLEVGNKEYDLSKLCL
jgi:hypothetical protein